MLKKENGKGSQHSLEATGALGHVYRKTCERHHHQIRLHIEGSTIWESANKGKEARESQLARSWNLAFPIGCHHLKPVEKDIDQHYFALGEDKNTKLYVPL